MRLQPIGHGPAQDLVLQDVIGIRLAQDPQQSACSAGQVLDDGLDVGMCGTDGNAEARGDLRERLMFAKVDQADLSMRRIGVDIVDRNPRVRGFHVVRRRWVVERSIGWIMMHRPLARDYETLTTSSEAMIHVAPIDYPAKRMSDEATVTW
jgi:hypothetical protein